MSVLVIEGFGCDPDICWYADNLVGEGEHQSEAEKRDLKTRWAALGGVRRVNLTYGMTTEKICAAIMSENTRAIVVADLSYEHAAFEAAVGASLRAYVLKGGRVAFPTTEGMFLLPTLTRLFETRWRGSCYSRKTWAIVPENAERVRELFGENPPFSAKACAIHAPAHERCFATVDADYSKEDVEVCCAVHAFGVGVVAYFGDVNGEPETCALIAAFCASRGKLCETTLGEPLLEDDPDALLASAELARAQASKAAGNAHFAAARYVEALGSYALSETICAEREGGAEERALRVVVCSNSAECALRLGDNAAALKHASAALALDERCVKALLRRAKAKFAFLKTLESDPDALDSVLDDLEYARRQLAGGRLPRDAEALRTQCAQAQSARFDTLCRPTSEPSPAPVT